MTALAKRVFPLVILAAVSFASAPAKAELDGMGGGQLSKLAPLLDIVKQEIWRRALRPAGAEGRAHRHEGAVGRRLERRLDQGIDRPRTSPHARRRVAIDAQMGRMRATAPTSSVNPVAAKARVTNGLALTSSE